MSGDAEQDYFVDGIVEDILTTLSKVPQLFVIARNSSFIYKGQLVDVRRIGRELGVKFVVEGSVRKAGNRVRVTAQLVECATGGHIWADRFDGELDDIFALQDRITQEVVIALEVNLTEGEVIRVWRERAGSPLVYEAFHKAAMLYRNFARETHRQVLQLLEKALTVNPDYTPALYIYGLTLVDQARFGWTTDRNAAFDEALAFAERALAIDPDYGEAYTVISYARSFQRRHDEAVEAAEKAVALSPNGHGALHMAAMTHTYAGNFRTGRDYEEQASRLSPLDIQVSMIDLARAQYHLGAYEEARQLAAQVLQSQPRWLTAQTILLAALWRLRREDEACDVAALVTRGHPKFSVARWANAWPYRRPEDLAAMVDPLLEAGLPE
jgi:TolB-like protein